MLSRKDRSRRIKASPEGPKNIRIAAHYDEQNITKKKIACSTRVKRGVNVSFVDIGMEGDCKRTKGKTNSNVAAACAYPHVASPSSITIMASSLDEAGYSLLDTFLDTFRTRVTTSDDVNDMNITHLIVRVDRDCVCKQRTMKYLVALTRGLWIVTTKWLKACLQRSVLVPEEEYQALKDVKADSVACHVPNTARLAHINRKLLFRDKQVLLYGGYPSPNPNKTQLSSLISVAGGHVYETLSSVWASLLGLHLFRGQDNQERGEKGDNPELMFSVAGDWEASEDLHAEINVVCADMDNVDRLNREMDMHIRCIAKRFEDDGNRLTVKEEEGNKVLLGYVHTFTTLPPSNQMLEINT